MFITCAYISAIIIMLLLFIIEPLVFEFGGTLSRNLACNSTDFRNVTLMSVY